MILAGEIGATRTRLAAFDSEGTKLQLVFEKTYMSQEHGGLAELITGFIKTEGIPVHSACFGVAGPVTAGRSKISNLPWIIDRRELAGQLKLEFGTKPRTLLEKSLAPGNGANWPAVVSFYRSKVASGEAADKAYQETRDKFAKKPADPIAEKRRRLAELAAKRMGAGR